MSIDKFKMAEKALNRFEKLYGTEIIKIFSIANGYISRELTDGTVAGVRMVLEYYGVKENGNTLWIKSKTKFYSIHSINVVSYQD